jgi:Flp pilus assembly pilin Flp
VRIGEKPFHAKVERPAPVEYALVLAVIGAVVLAALTLLSSDVRNAFIGLL